MARLTRRDIDIVKNVNVFKQLTTQQIRAMNFPTNKSDNPCHVRLRRLVELGYLARVQQRTVGGDTGGSGQYVYQLGAAGWRLCERDGSYWAYRAVNAHALGTADVYIMCREAESRGRIVVHGFAIESDAWEVIGEQRLKPDMLLDLSRTDNGERYQLWVEIDNGTQGQRVIMDKLDRYIRAYDRSEREERVLFVANDEERVTALKWLMGRHTGEYRPLFAAVTKHRFLSLFGA